ncbi:MAG: TIM-barrel domain-containing protein [Pleomorphochaeta sp.]
MENSIFFQNKKDKVLIEAYSNNIIRVRHTKLLNFRDFDWALDDIKSISNVKIGDNCLITESMKVVIDEKGNLEFYRKGETSPRIQEKKSPRALHEGGRNLVNVGGDLFKAEVLFNAYENEKIWGMGQHQYNSFDQKGLVISLNQMNSQVSVPFYISSRGYGLFWNNPAVGQVEFAKNRTKFIAEQTEQIDYFIIICDTYKAILNEYFNLTGTPSALPYWATGFWQCKLRYETQEELLQVAREYKKRNLPLDVIVIDYFHWEKQGNWDFDKKCWPDVKTMINELKSMDIEIMVSIWPSVNPDSLYFDEMEKKGYLIETERSNAALMRFTDTYEKGSKYIHYYDATNKDAGSFVWDKVKKNYIDKGINIFWLDACEPETIPYHYDNQRYSLGKGSAVASLYPMLHEKTFYENMKNVGIKEPLNLCRSAWSGSQKYGAAVWSGDIDSTFESLETQMKAGLNMVISGIPWWTTDIGGFYGGVNDDPSFRELIVRWFQFGLYCPIFRLHGFRNSWNLKKGSDNEIWSFGEKNYEIIKKYLLFRDVLRGYINEEAKKTVNLGIPLMRPLFFDYENDEKVEEIDDQFMFGEQIMVAPIVKEHQVSRKVYLPKDEVWINAYTKEEFEGGVEIIVNAPLEEIPTFIKKENTVLKYYDILR